MGCNPIKYLTLVLILGFCQGFSQTKKIKYPNSKINIVNEKISGITISDEYRYLEKTDSAEVINWFEKQTVFTDSILNSYSKIDSIESKINEINNRTLSWAKSLKTDDLGNMYYLKYREEDEFYMLFFREKNSQNETILFDPQSYNKGSGLEYYIDYILPSWNGRYVAISLRHSNVFDSEVVVFDTKTNELTNDLVKQTRPKSYGGLNWLPDSSGFTYLHFPIVNKGEEGYKTNSVTRFHAINSGNTLGKNVFGANDKISINPEYLPIININSSDDEYAIAYIMDNSHYYSTYYTDINSLSSGKVLWKPFYKGEDSIYSNLGKEKAKNFYYLSAKNTPNFQINYVSLNDLDFSNPKVYIEEKSNEVISDFVFVKGGAYYTSTVNGVEMNLYYKNEDSTKKVVLPFVAGSIDIVSSHGKGDQIVIENSGWANDLTRYTVKEGKVMEQLIIAKVPIMPEFDNLVTEVFFVVAHDGESIPVTLIYDKKKGKFNRPAIIESYGAYGHNSKSSFNPTMLTSIELGCIRVIAHIRGGGEKGKAWHDAGKKETKSNSWQDIISVTEFLVDKGYTSENKTVLYSESAGAISQAMAINTRPELYAVFISRVPLLNPSRLREGSHAQLSFNEFGNINKPEEAKFLIKMDPYYNLNIDKPFPPTLLYTAGKDDRLDIWEVGKFIAKLQNSRSALSPSLLKLMPEWSHGSTTQRASAEMFGFALEHVE